jgi:putative DNA primase/helicase
MDEIIRQFIDDMAAHNLAPASSTDIKPDNKRHDYQLAIDPKRKKKGYYKLKTESGFGFGFFGDYRTNDCISWHSKTDQSYTDAEKKAFREKVEKERKEQEESQRKTHEEKANEPNDFLLFLDNCETTQDHPYLIKKGVKPYHIFLSGDDLIIPLKNNEGVWNYQTIREDGTKLFVKGAKKGGTWFEIPGSETIAIVEGYATGASVHEAAGYTVIVALDAGNMIMVAPEIRRLKPDARIIICADNDMKTYEKRGFNPGLDKGKEAARLIDAEIVWPEFEDEKTFSDFNDYHAINGLENLRNIIQDKAHIPLPETAAGGTASPFDVSLQPPGGDPDKWQEGLVKKKGKVDALSIINLSLVMEHCPTVAGVFKYDSFSKRIIVFKCPPWENENIFNVRTLADHDYFRLAVFLDQMWGLKVSKDNCSSSIVSVSMLPCNTLNPASDYFNALQWDGVKRLDSWLTDYVTDKTQPAGYLSLVGIKFMCGLAARAMRPGIKFDTMIILEGKQYAGKSYLSRIMGTINGEEYFLDDFKDIDNKDSLMKIQGKLVVEFPEISTMRKAEINDLKAFLSRQDDEFRPPYGRNTITAPRQCVFIGTVNPEGPYLRDITGNRRYWPVACQDKLPIEDLKEVMPLLHAEAAHLVREGEQLWLDDEQYELCAVEQDKRMMFDLWTDQIKEITDTISEISTDEILSQLGIVTEKRSTMVYQRIHQIMAGLGWSSDRVGKGNKRKRGFIKNNVNIKNTQNNFEEIEF